MIVSRTEAQAIMRVPVSERTELQQRKLALWFEVDREPDRGDE